MSGGAASRKTRYEKGRFFDLERKDLERRELERKDF